MITLKCRCGAVLYQDKSKYPPYSAIGCPKCKLVSKVERPSVKDGGPEVRKADRILFRTEGAP